MQSDLLENAELAAVARAMRRSAEATLISGNVVTLLRDGPAVFDAWLSDIASAQHFVLFENYIFRSDRIGNRIADALIERARAGVEVCLLFDWLGCIGTNRQLWLRMQKEGVRVRAFRSLRLRDPLRVLQRNHRKVLCVDGVVGFVGGLCVGDAWAGDPDLGVPPWRDTAVRVVGPAAAELATAFEETWALAGPSASYAPVALGPDEARLQAAEAMVADPSQPVSAASSAGAAVRVISGLPGRSRIYRLTQVLLANAARRIWITDAYFLTPPTMYEALLAAARDGVDVRVLVPGRSDLPWVSWMGRAGFAGLLEAGVRIFEWEGPMLHAKTTVVDGLWCRVGSSNLNLASLLTNWELDVVVEDARIGAAMERMFLEDLASSRELILQSRRVRVRIQRAATPPALPELVVVDGVAGGAAAVPVVARTRGGMKGGRTGVAVARAGAAVLGVALRRRYQQSTWTVSLVVALVMLLLGGVGLRWSAQLGMVVASLLLWLGLAELLHAAGTWGQRPRSSRKSRGRAAKRRSSSGRLPMVGSAVVSGASPEQSQVASEKAERSV